jgi:ethanolamine ammonia-lyase large subunit
MTMIGNSDAFSLRVQVREREFELENIRAACDPEGLAHCNGDVAAYVRTLRDSIAALSATITDAVDREAERVRVEADERSRTTSVEGHRVPLPSNIIITAARLEFGPIEPPRGYTKTILDYLDRDYLARVGQ